MIAIRKYIEILFYYAKGDFVMKLPNYYEDPNTLHVGTCENRSYYTATLHYFLVTGTLATTHIRRLFQLILSLRILMIPLWIPSRFLPAGSATDMIIISILM